MTVIRDQAMLDGIAARGREGGPHEKIGPLRRQTGRPFHHVGPKCDRWRAQLVQTEDAQ